MPDENAELVRVYSTRSAGATWMTIVDGVGRSIKLFQSKAEASLAAVDGS